MSPAADGGGDGSGESGDGGTELDGTYRATIDRVVEGQAVLLVEADGEVVAERQHPAESLPEGAGEGVVCEVTFADGELLEIGARADETAARRRRLRERFDALSRRLGDESAADRDEE